MASLNIAEIEGCDLPKVVVFSFQETANGIQVIDETTYVCVVLGERRDSTACSHY